MRGELCVMPLTTTPGRLNSQPDVVIGEEPPNSSMGRRSSIWNHFGQPTLKSAKCNVCNECFSLSGGPTSVLWDHLRSHHQQSVKSRTSPSTKSRLSCHSRNVSHLRRRSLSSLRKAKNQKRVSLNPPASSCNMIDRRKQRLSLNNNTGSDADDTPRLRSQRHLFDPLPHVQVPSTSTRASSGKLPTGPNKYKRQKRDILTGRGKPAELFRTDLVSAMKVNDHEVLDPTLAVPISDPWRSEWNHGVQVPVNQDPIASVPVTPLSPEFIARISTAQPEFKLPTRLVHCSPWANVCDKEVSVSNVLSEAKQVVRYDLDNLDEVWLAGVNRTRKSNSGPLMHQLLMERVVESLESLCHQRLHTKLLECGAIPQGREFDDDTVCDVCLSPFTEDGDEMVFCDRCDLCVHQSCYGIAWLPEGQWLCRLCSLAPARMPHCVFCPNQGGAMKCSASGETWAHIACVLWIPEVRFGDPEAREPVKNIKKVPDERWNLRCSLCRSREGACIQCSEGACHVAYHVTCAQKNGLRMLIQRTTHDDGVELNSFCNRHSASEGGCSTPPPDCIESRGLPLSMVDSPNRRKQRRLTSLEKHFHDLVSAEEVANNLHAPIDLVTLIYEYWKLKRKVINENRALIADIDEEAKAVERHEKEQILFRVNMLKTMRRNLERARNLCYMVERREKLKLQHVVTVESITNKLVGILHDEHKLKLMTKRGVDSLKEYLSPMSNYDDLINSDSSLNLTKSLPT